ncbi:MAG: hypothetical protein OSA99_16740, partial [Acidimicrobiales bacterium]|nr:hypothetical protein [Acidimicrobiales bacterium]
MSAQTPTAHDSADPGEVGGERRRSRSDARRARRRRAQRIVHAIAVISAIVGSLADGAPTGIVAVDAGYRALLAALIVVIAARAERWTLFVLAGVAGAIGSNDPVPLSLSALALALSFAGLRRRRRRKELGAIVGAVGAQALLRLPTDLPAATPTIAVAVVVLVLMVSALRHDRRPTRYLYPAAATLLVVGVASVAFVVGMMTIDSHAEEAVAASRAGLDAAASGDDAASVAAFTIADRAFAAAGRTADAWWMTPARVVPVLAPHVEAVREVSAQGRSLAELGTDQAAVLDIRGLSNDDGGLDLEAIADLAPRAVAVADALDEAGRVLDETDSPWLVGQVTDRIDSFAVEIADVAPTARLAADALTVAPA